MKAVILAIILTLGVVTMFTACERNDYQHPGYRSNNK
jgi:hypothetical protein